MKKISIILVAMMVILGTVSAVAEKAEAPFTALIPVSRQGLFRVDPDTSSIGLSRCEEVTTQTSVAEYAKDGFVVGAKSASDMLLRDMQSEVGVWDFKILDTTEWPEPAKSLDGQELIDWMVSQGMRVVYIDGKVYVTLNVEPYKKGFHVAQANIWVGAKEGQYWTLFLRPDGIWTLCTTGNAGGKQGGTQPPQEAVPQDEGRDPEPPEEDTPVAVPQDPGRDGDDNGDAGYTDPPAADPHDLGQDSTPADTGTTVTEEDDDDNGDGGYRDNPLLATGENQGAGPSDPGRD